jgi:hypothetical protein
LEIPKITCSGDYIDISLRKGSLVNYGSRPPLPPLSDDAFLESLNQESRNSGMETMAIREFKHLVTQVITGNGERSKVEAAHINDTPMLNYIKDRIHEDFSHTIEYNLKKKSIPAPDIAHSRPTAIALSNPTPQFTTPGPGSYRPQDANVAHAPQILINPPRVVLDESKGEIVPLKERMRRERQQKSLDQLLSQYKRTAEAHSADNHHRSSPAKMNPPKFFLRTALTEKRPASFGTASPRFEGTAYHTESYIKTSGMILGPDYDKKMEERYQLGPKFGQSPARGNEVKKDVFLDGPDIMRFCSLTAEAERSPIKYSAAFRPPSPKISMKERLMRSRSPQRHQREQGHDGMDLNASQTLSGTIDEHGNVVKNTLSAIQEPLVDDIDDAILGDGSHLGPGAFFPNCAPSSIEIHNPNKPSLPFMQVKSTRSRLTAQLQEEENARLAEIEKERKLIDAKFREERLQRERMRGQSMIPLGQKRK